MIDRSLNIILKNAKPEEPSLLYFSMVWGVGSDYHPSIFNFFLKRVPFYSAVVMLHMITSEWSIHFHLKIQIEW